MWRTTLGSISCSWDTKLSGRGPRFSGGLAFEIARSASSPFPHTELSSCPLRLILGHPQRPCSPSWHLKHSILRFEGTSSPPAAAGTTW